MRLMSYVHYNLLQNLNNVDDDFYCTKRAFFYSLKNEFIKRFVVKQGKVDWAINEISMLLECGPWELGFISTSKGLVAGDLSVYFGEEKVIHYEQRNYHAVPDVIANVTQVRTCAAYVLVVEKDSVFQKLLREECPSFNNCILVTGKGYPDIPTRMFVRMLSEKVQLPIYALVDANPHGFEIMCVYR
ncbi:PREDICTED: meiotic recombination protein SPO11-1 [Ceratosolen solmsi marchali]|uniref:Meiotic recombination protein SPO11-1 n=1 Tax=Ceratosolen solmsi marchali TaxID=326594 RepID=A0AAJ6YP51_9HYME|nr:PREDICTED: meiotic recombination protein SPO11-1 [Ceratosolen solmsi marchali]